MIKILVDADACPTIDIIEKLSKNYHIETTYVTDTSHNITSDTNKVIIVDKGSDSADYKILSLCDSDTIVVTQDYALAGLCLTKNAYVLHTNAFIINKDNIDTLLTSRYLNQKARKAKEKTINPKKRKEETNLLFESILKDLIINNK
ncbi:uncharacterized protein YaiI (UPF0178 family) [Bacilli bacterium PM5-3]|nr:uncharacterized protein YaiI (UPF0178 family) [Bacilli bacterium PM5-3]MDH6604348.1 uncharacterized protein YaiI (UPF0178 family) [Bacilli bacterium PM5-9]